MENSPTLMSVLLPAGGVLLAHDARAAGLGPTAVRSALLAALAQAVTVALVGLVLGVVIVVVAGGGLGPPATVALLAAGGVAVQVTAQLVGTGMGFLFRGPWVGFLATIVAPLGLWSVLGLLGPLAASRAWTTPFGALAPLVSGAPRAVDVLAWLVVLALWGVLLNAAGLLVAGRRGRNP